MASIGQGKIIDAKRLSNQNPEFCSQSEFGLASNSDGGCRSSAVEQVRSLAANGVRCGLCTRRCTALSCMCMCACIVGGGPPTSLHVEAALADMWQCVSIYQGWRMFLWRHVGWSVRVGQMWTGACKVRADFFRGQHGTDWPEAPQAHLECGQHLFMCKEWQ